MGSIKLYGNVLKIDNALLSPCSNVPKCALQFYGPKNVLHEIYSHTMKIERLTGWKINRIEQKVATHHKHKKLIVLSIRKKFRRYQQSPFHCQLLKLSIGPKPFLNEFDQFCQIRPSSLRGIRRGCKNSSIEGINPSYSYLFSKSNVIPIPISSFKKELIPITKLHLRKKERQITNSFTNIITCCNR